MAMTVAMTVAVAMAIAVAMALSVAMAMVNTRSHRERNGAREEGCYLWGVYRMDRLLRTVLSAGGAPAIYDTVPGRYATPRSLCACVSLMQGQALAWLSASTTAGGGATARDTQARPIQTPYLRMYGFVTRP